MPAVQYAPTTIGGMADELYNIRERKRLLLEQIERLDAQAQLLEASLMARLDDEQTTKGQGHLASISITESVVGRVSDWDALFAFVAANNAFHLLQRRTSDPAIREMFQLKGNEAVPGVEPFTKRKLNIRRL